MAVYCKSLLLIILDLQEVVLPGSIELLNPHALDAIKHLLMSLVHVGSGG